jgi:hypothetical protein
VFNLL